MNFQSTVKFCLTTVVFVLLGACHLLHAGDSGFGTSSGPSESGVISVHAFDFERTGVHSVPAPAGDPFPAFAVRDARNACFVAIDNLLEMIVELGGTVVQIEIEDQGVLWISDVREFFVANRWEKYIVAEYFVRGNITYVDASGGAIQIVLMVESH